MHRFSLVSKDTVLLFLVLWHISSLVFRAFLHSFLLIENRPLNSKWGIWDMVLLCSLYQKRLKADKGVYSFNNYS